MIEDEMDYRHEAMKTNDLISILIPVYNVEAYVAKCLQSVVDQTYRHLQIVIVIDGSKDGSEAICREFAAKDERIEIHNFENAGLAETRNRLLALAKGRYSLFLDSDDYLVPDAVEFLHEKIRLHDADIAEGNSIRFSEGVEVDRDLGPWVPTEPETDGVWNCEEAMYFYPHCRELRYSAWAKLYKTELFEGIHYDPAAYFEDMDTTYRIIAKAKRYYHTNRIVMYYLIRGSGLVSVQKKSDYLKRTRRAYERMFQFYLENFPQLRGEVARRHLGTMLSEYRLAVKSGSEAFSKEVVTFLPLYDKADLLQGLSQSISRNQKVNAVLYAILGKRYLWLLRF